MDQFLGFVVSGGSHGRMRAAPCTNRRTRVAASTDGNFEFEKILSDQLNKMKQTDNKLHNELQDIAKKESIQLPRLPKETERAPRPHLSVEDTIVIQLLALQRNDFPEIDAGLATVLEFAAPMNRMSVGRTVEKFSKYVRNSIYAMMLNCREWRLSEVTLTSEGRRASIGALITATDGKTRQFLWNLGKHKVWKNGEFDECWLVDAVISTDYRGKLVIE